MISVESLTYSYPPLKPGQPWQTALDDVSFDIEAGTCAAITGPNNAGKTTLCLSVAGLAPRLTIGQLDGQILVEGKDVQEAPPGALSDLIGLVLQESSGQLFNPTVEAEIAWGMENLGVPPTEMRKRINWVLGAVGLADLPRSQPPQTLSGGQQKRLALAAALALKPKVLILDQPAGGLAPAARAEMIAVLRDLKSSENLTILLTENDPAVIAALADRVLILNQGRIVASGTPREIFGGMLYQGITLPPTSQFMAQLNGHRRLVSNCLTAEEAAAEILPILPNGPGPVKKSTRTPDDAPPAVELTRLSFAYDQRLVLADLDLTIPSGQFAVLTGDNGAGKTTLSKHLIGLLRPTEGTVKLFGEDIAKRPIGQIARQVGFAFQNPEVQIFNPTVYEEVAFGPHNISLDNREIRCRIEEALEQFGLADLSDYPPAELSFSTRRMVALASVAALNTPILVLDEPTVGLDAAGCDRVVGWLEGRHRAGATIILITHDMEMAARCAERLLVLDGGRIAADGLPADVFSQAAVLRQAGLEPPFAVQLATLLDAPWLAADLTPQGAARTLSERLP
ncbi:MAG: energy-coupling factor ABC transporter ATP-binding protein [Anaerolineae bacterium]|nr:energy-coupling factor ABC transporter ATP-binding protein [Anaerolineae bacterium]